MRLDIYGQFVVSVVRPHGGASKGRPIAFIEEPDTCRPADLLIPTVSANRRSSGTWPANSAPLRNPDGQYDGSIPSLTEIGFTMSRPDDELQFYGPIPSTVSRWLLLMFWPLAFFVASFSWWLN